jgi:uncharacterized protein
VERLPHSRGSGSLGPRLILAALLALLLLPSAGLFYTELLWFTQLGYRSVFLQTFTAKASLGSSVTLIAFLVLFGSFRLALRGVRIPVLVVRGGNGRERSSVAIDDRTIRVAVGLAAAFVAVLMGVAASSRWLAWELFLRAPSFGQADPILGYDLGFFLFRLPILEGVQGLAVGVLAVALAGSAALHAVGGGLRLAPSTGLLVSTAARRQLALTAAALLLALAAGAWLERPRLLISPADVLYGASAADVEARMPALALQALVGCAAALAAIWSAFARRFWPLLAGALAFMAVAMAGEGYAVMLQRFVITPNELVREAPYIEHNIAATRRAFGVQDVEEREMSGDAALTRDDIARNEATIRNVRLWDHGPLLDTFGQIQEIRTYYDFVSVDNDRYVLDGDYRQIMLSPRELDSASLPNRTWINERLTFTHGYGLTLGPVNAVTQEGLPLLFIKDLPPQSSVDLPVEQPSIYYGERSNDYVLVNTAAREFHYPEGEDNVFTRYEGSGGVPAGGLLRKLLFSLRFNTLKILLSSDLGPETKILFHRRIQERVSVVAPFLSLDPDPYMVISEGRLFWILDAYTVSDRYPYATPIQGINYIRNSVKVVVDAYNGTTTFYLVDPDDPIATALGDVFPELLTPLGEMPEDLKRHLRYPEQLFGIQAQVFTTFHMTNPEVFYNKEDQWEIPVTDDGGRRAEMEPYYTIMKLPGEQREEFIQMLPFTPRNKGNLAAWMVARSDGEHYGKLLAFQFPKQKVVFGPAQIEARINQDQEISPQITLWNQQGSEVIQGTLLVIPIEESLLYVRPLYLRAQGGRIPELKRVIVAHQNQIVMEETLDRALERMFGGEVFPTPSPPASDAAPAPTADEVQSAPPSGSLATQAREHYERALAAQRAGDWARYGEEIRALGDLLRQLAPEQPAE